MSTEQIRVFPLLAVGLCLYRQVEGLRRDYPLALVDKPDTGLGIRALVMRAQDDEAMLMQAIQIVGDIDAHREKWWALFWLAKHKPLEFASLAATAEGIKRDGK